MVLSKKSLSILAAFVLTAFLVGYIPLFLDNRDLTARLVQVQDRLQMATMQNDLGLIFLEVAQDNFGNARERSARFFNNLQQAASTVRDGQLRGRLTAILSRRDAITSDLASLDPETLTRLRMLYLEFPKDEAPIQPVK
jgi:hypothetical protein